MVDKPDVFVCQNCGERFQKAKYVTVEEDGVYVDKPTCPKCGSEDLVVSSWSLQENPSE